MPETPPPSFVPAVGATVHYVLPRSPRKHRPAVITRIRTNGTLDLFVMTTATRYGRSAAFNVRRVSRDVSATVGGTWHPGEAADPAHIVADYVAPPAPQIVVEAGPAA